MLPKIDAHLRIRASVAQLPQRLTHSLGMHFRTGTLKKAAQKIACTRFRQSLQSCNSQTVLTDCRVAILIRQRIQQQGGFSELNGGLRQRFRRMWEMQVQAGKHILP